MVPILILTLFSFVCIATVYMVFVNRLAFKKILSGINVLAWTGLILSITLGIYLMTVTPTIFFTLHDEGFYLRQAEDISEGHIYVSDKSVGYPFIMSLVFSIAGADIGTAYALNMFFGIFSIFLIFLVSYVFFGREDVAVYSSLIFSILPLQIIVSRSLESNIAAVFALLVPLLCFSVYMRKTDFKTQMMAAVSLAFAIHFRLEFLLLLPLFGLLLVFSERELPEKVRDYRWWLPWVILAVISVPWMLNVSHIALSSPGDNPYIHEERMRSEIFSLNALARHGVHAGNLFVKSNFFPDYMFLPLILGPLSMLRRKKRKLLFLLVFFGVFSLLYLSFDIPQNRYFMIPYVIVVLLWAKGLSFITDYARAVLDKARKTEFTRWFLMFVVCLSIVWGFAPYMTPLKEDLTDFRSSTMLFWEEREVYLERDAFSYLNQNLGECDIVLLDNDFFVSETLSPVRAETLVENPESVNSSGCLIFLEDLYCRAPMVFYDEGVTEHYTRICEGMKERFDLSLYKKFEISLGEGYKNFEPDFIEGYSANFTLYNVSMK